MARPVSVLVVDDEPPIRRLLRATLGAQGHQVVEAAGGVEALEQIERERPDLVILDLGLPDLSGLEVIRSVRAHSSLPIVVLSVRADERDKVEALDLGADDYLTKPFGTDELVARVRAALRHRFQAQGEAPVFVCGGFSVDRVRRMVRRDGAEVHLSPKEYDLLAELVANVGRVLTHRHILAKVWGPAHTEDAQYLRVFIRNLRQKLEADPTQPRYIITEPGVGYRLRAEAGSGTSA
jgi:two-component system KDP operon response regulator KdpE